MEAGSLPKTSQATSVGYNYTAVTTQLKTYKIQAGVISTPAFFMNIFMEEDYYEDGYEYLYEILFV